jgi:hypothetical protein
VTRDLKDRQAELAAASDGTPSRTGLTDHRYHGIPSDVVLLDDLPASAICRETGEVLPATEEYWCPYLAIPGALHLGAAYRPGDLCRPGKLHWSRKGFAAYKARLERDAQAGRRQVRTRRRGVAR